MIRAHNKCPRCGTETMKLTEDSTELGQKEVCTICNYDKRTSVQIAILTLDSLWASREDFDKFNTQVFNAWGIGQKESNNGILLGICPEYRKFRITTGHGIEKVLTSPEMNKIIDNDILPYFKNDDYYNGVLNGVQKIIQALDAKNDSTIYRKNSS